jgi:hypothetical protein
VSNLKNVKRYSLHNLFLIRYTHHNVPLIGYFPVKPVPYELMPANTSIASDIPVITCTLSDISYKNGPLRDIPNITCTSSDIPNITCTLSDIPNITCTLSDIPSITYPLSDISCNLSLMRYSHRKFYLRMYSLRNVSLMNRWGSSVSKLRGYDMTWNEIKWNACVPVLSDTALVYVQPNAEQAHQHVCHFRLSPRCI